MAKKRRSYTSRYLKKQYDLDSVADTSETGSERTTTGSKRGDEYDEYVKIPPPFKGEKSSRPITWSELSYIYKVIAVLVSLFLTIGVPSIWFASKMDTNVKNIENDVREVKQTTRNLVETTIKNTSKIDNVEKSLLNLTQQVENNKKQ